jgi:hypothetical protein
MNRKTITNIGKFNNHGSPAGWDFDRQNDIPAFSVTDNGVLYAGYTVEESKTIAESAKPQ